MPRQKMIIEAMAWMDAPGVINRLFVAPIAPRTNPVNQRIGEAKIANTTVISSGIINGAIKSTVPVNVM